MEVYLTASGAYPREGNVQTAIVLNCAGPRVFEVYDSMYIVWENAARINTNPITF